MGGSAGGRGPVDGVQADARQQAMLDAVATPGTAASPDGAVRATVDPRGTLLGLELTRRAYELRPETLGALIVELVRDARADAERGMTDALGRLGSAPPRPMSEQRFQDALRQLDSFDFGRAR